jgi:hypothetical protein
LQCYPNKVLVGILPDFWVFSHGPAMQAPMEDLRTQARDALLQGARSGKLLEAPASWLHGGINVTAW